MEVIIHIIMKLDVLQILKNFEKKKIFLISLPKIKKNSKWIFLSMVNKRTFSYK